MIAKILAILAITLLVCGAVALSDGKKPIQAQSLQPNFVILLADDMRADNLQYMPILQEKLASHGVTFTNAHASTAQCCAVRASFLSGGFMPKDTGVLTNDGPNGGFSHFPEQGSLPVDLQQNGYRTALIGKYLNEYENAGAYVPRGWTSWVATPEYKFSDFKVVRGQSDATHSSTGTISTVTGQYLTDFQANETIAFIESNQNSPFFVYTAFVAPHAPATPDAQDVGTFANAILPIVIETDISDKPLWVQWLSGNQTQAQKDARLDFAKKQLESLQSVDRAVGAIVDKLADLNLLDNTVIVFASDHGFMWGEHGGLGNKLAPYEQSIKSALVVRFDGGSYPVRNATQVTAWNRDVPATIYDIAGISHSYGRSNIGKSLKAILEGSNVIIRNYAVLQGYDYNPTGMNNKVLWAGVVSQTGYKYVEYATGEKEFYDLNSDPHELQNQIGNTSYSTIKNAMAAQLPNGRGLAITTSELPDAVIGQPYSFQLQMWPGKAPHCWTITSGNLPAGLSLDSATGVISGSPQTEEGETFQITVTDSSQSGYDNTSQKFTSTFTIGVTE